VVGDDDQSIYAWRGAEPRNLLDFDRDFPDVVEIKLEQNYRSTSVILDAANAVIAGNRDRRGKALWTERGGGDPIVHHEAGDERGEAEWVARTLRQHGRRRAVLAGRRLPPVPDQRPVARARGAAAGASASCQGGRRDRVLRAQGGQGRAGLPAADRQPRGRLGASSASSTSPPRGIGETTIEQAARAGGPATAGCYAAAREVARGGGGLGPAAAASKLVGFVELIDGLRAVITPAVRPRWPSW
jgi:DNA helicase-2/ATP-dependent DNA helicase PcrA